MGVSRIVLKRRDGTYRADVLVDDDDLRAVEGYQWHWNVGYACTRIDGKKVYMHRLLMDAPPGMEVDHINGVKIDNRRSNLRVVTHRENQQNRVTVQGKSRYRGVYWYSRDGVWVVGMKVNGKNLYFGRFQDEDEAGAKAAEVRREVFPGAVS